MYTLVWYKPHSSTNLSHAIFSLRPRILTFGTMQFPPHKGQLYLEKKKHVRAERLIAVDSSRLSARRVSIDESSSSGSACLTSRLTPSVQGPRERTARDGGYSSRLPSFDTPLLQIDDVGERVYGYARASRRVSTEGTFHFCNLTGLPCLPSFL